MKIRYAIIAAGTVLMFAGCSMAPKLVIPKTDLPLTYTAVNKNGEININWWKGFDDSNLNKLIAEALKNNDDLKLAVIRVNEASSYLELSRANLYPVINAAASGYRQKSSNKIFGGGAIFNSFTISPSIGYELDLWGKLKNRKTAEISSVLAAQANRAAVKLTLISDVASIYFNLVSVNNQIRITETAAESFRQIYEYRKNQYKYGDINEMAVYQAKAQYENSKLLIESIKQEKTLLASALSMLLGKTPKEIFEAEIMLNKRLPKPAEVPVGLPSTLLENRPDIKSAEENLRAKNAMVGAAKAAYFPNISLTGSFGYQSKILSDLIDSSAEIWQIGKLVNMPVFNFGRIKSNIKISEAEKGAALISYEKTVRNAFKEVYDALNKLKISREKLKMRQKLTASLKKVLMLSKKRFEYGYSSHPELLDAQIKFLNAKLNLVRSNEEVIANEILLYKALGGGWSTKQLQN